MHTADVDPWGGGGGCGWAVRFLRYFFPLEADRQREFHGHLDTQRMSISSPLQGVGATRKDTVKLPMYGHYDVCTTWDTVGSLSNCCDPTVLLQRSLWDDVAREMRPARLLARRETPPWRRIDS